MNIQIHTLSYKNTIARFTTMIKYYSINIKPTDFSEETMNSVKDVNQFIEIWNSVELYITQNTSGSTGVPKRIRISKEQMKASSIMTSEALQLDKMTTALLCISPNFIGGKMMIVRSLMNQLTLHVTAPTSNPLSHITHPIDFCAMVPVQVQTILEKQPEKLDLLGTLIIGGGAVSNKTVELLKNRSCNVYSTFGMTETVSHIALCDLKNEPNLYHAIGKTSFSEEQGQLVVNAPDLGIEQLKTNDLVEIIDFKSFRWLGRADNVINSGGIKLFPELIEMKLEIHVNPIRFFIGGKKDPKLGERLVFLTTNKSMEDNDFEVIFNKVLTKYERPKEIIRVPSFEYTSNEKIQRKLTLEKYGIE